MPSSIRSWTVAERARWRKRISTILYTPEGQAVAAEHYLRPSDPEVAARYADRFPKLEMLSIADFGGWAAAQKTHFAEGGVFDQIYRPGS